MSDGTGIEWADATWNPVAGCTRVSAGCDHCYAVGMTHRLAAMGQEKYAGLTVLNGKGERHFNGKVRCVPEALAIPLGWKKPRRVFVNSMSDLFHKDVPLGFLHDVFAVMALCRRHTFMVLTKRPERMAEYFASNPAPCWRVEGAAFKDEFKDKRWAAGAEPWDGNFPLPNVHLYASCEDQKTLDERVPHLLKCPAAVRGLSLEPLLGPVDLGQVEAWRTAETGMLPDGSAPELDIDHVIVGGESGKGARPCCTGWIRSIVTQCKDAGVPVFVKQLGSNPKPYRAETTRSEARAGSMKLKDAKSGDMAEWAEDLRVRELPVTQEVAA